MALKVEHRRLVEQLLGWLGYTGKPNWVDDSNLSHARGCRYLLTQAFSSMDVVGAFGLRRQRPNRNDPDFLPFVYVAFAQDDVHGGGKAGHWSVGDVLTRAE